MLLAPGGAVMEISQVLALKIPIIQLKEILSYHVTTERYWVKVFGVMGKNRYPQFDLISFIATPGGQCCQANGKVYIYLFSVGCQSA